MARSRTSSRASLARQATIVACFVVASLLGILTGVLVAYTGDLPQVSALDEYKPSTITRLYASDGRVIGEFATQRRVNLKYEEIPTVMRQAILAAEDAEFEHHIGIRPVRLLVTLARNVLVEHRLMGGGASTLTQQLARKLFLKPDKTLERKVKEWVLTLQIEKRYTKQEIFTLYCNQMNLGHGAYGVEAAARLYFGKPVKDLKLEEAAVIAGILQLPERQSPYVNQKWATQRRNYTLGRMAKEGFITEAQAQAAQKKPIVLAGLPGPSNTTAPYFTEEVRQHLEHQYGAQELYEAGLSVQTTLDYDLQSAAAKALDRGLRDLDKRQGYRKPSKNVADEGKTPAGHNERRWNRPIHPGDIVPAVVMEVAAGSASTRPPAAWKPGRPVPPGSARVRVGKLEAVLSRAGFKWTGRTSASSLVNAGDLVAVEVTAIDEASGTLAVTLEQTPLVEGALLAIDNRTGQIRAMIGGFDFGRSKFNRAVQAPRQIGSAFKPVVFTAAIDRGYTPASILVDEPASYNVGPGQPPYAPQNYDRKYEGAVTLRRVLEESRNVPTVKLMEQLTPPQVIGYAHRLGFESPLQPYLSTALGASEATLLEVTSAYSAFPNQGVRMQPYSIVKVAERDGTVLEEHRPTAREGIRADTAFVMVNMLRGVVQRGTAAKAASLDWPLAGKTGTVDDYTDAWFVGFDPNITVGVWVGFDLKKPLGPGETGAAAALPIWMSFMKDYIDRYGDRRNPPVFDAPGNIVFVPIDRATGLPVEASAPGALNEAFIAGTQPGIGFPRQ
ncbi:MAG: penicillin-binding protein 1A [Rhodospirillaceae bacterium]